MKPEAVMWTHVYPFGTLQKATMELFVLGFIVVIIMVFQLSHGLIEDAIRIAPGAVEVATKVLESNAPDILSGANTTSAHIVDTAIVYKDNGALGLGHIVEVIQEIIASIMSFL